VGEPIAITGMGIVSSVGRTLDEVWDSMTAESDGLGPLTIFTSPRCGHVPVGEVKGDVRALSGLKVGSRTDHLAAYAARQAFEDAGLGGLGESALREAGVVMGTCTGGMTDAEVFLKRLILGGDLDIRLLPNHRCASPCNVVARALGLGGLRTTVSDACVSGAAAITTACDALRTGEADIILAGGADSLTRLTINGFNSLLNVSQGGCRPFDADRDGMSLGEGAGMLVLETERHARARGARIRAFVAGYGNTCDAFHATAPRPDGSGALRAMAAALRDAGLFPADVDYVNAHGTGTRENDAAEAAAIRGLFAPAIPCVSSTKRLFGHTLAAAGAIEAIVSTLAMERGLAPANVGLVLADGDLGFEPLRHTAPAHMDVVMSNSLGFGGVNSTLVLVRGPGCV
jgi:3-oxoacyl-(acyl-carrier-protein) synthase